ncbi:neuronal acetylcholine receptor subunit beta-3-like [Copidosoma floridanum]|uniref:neuronal acetylcholine receptor subunit beta-3-like n=1 Tax=Copidosoma floridanum TaxID=29053 RepID=UPI0006C976AE|nr:neuronal acetylcholine receptor subunit beta-3-like [Copidosoma floridanum]
MIRHLLLFIITFSTPNAQTIAAPAATVSSANSTLSRNSKVASWNETWVDQLRQNLLLNYDKFSRPAQHYNTTTVSLLLSIMQVELDSRKSILSINAWVHMSWEDEKLKWTSEDYGGVDKITVSAHEIWQPDLVLYNSAMYGVENYESRQCIVSESGLIKWVVPTVLRSFCKLNFEMWPFETNICWIDLVSWTHSGDEIDIELLYDGYYMEDYIPGEWVVKNISAHQTKDPDICCSNTVSYPAVSYEIKLTRSSYLFYHVTFLACLPIVFLVLVTFWMKPQSEMKLIYIICAVLIDILFLLYFGYSIPAKPGSIPLIVKFFSGCLYQMTVSILICGFVIHISTSSYGASMPRRVRSLLLGKIGKYLGLKSAIHEMEFQKLIEIRELTDLTIQDAVMNESMNSDRQSIILQSDHVKRLEWILLATAIDRLSFLLFCVAFTFSAVTYIRINDDLYAKNAYSV